VHIQQVVKESLRDIGDGLIAALAGVIDQEVEVISAEVFA
jgi:hypothetical protein